MIPNQAIGVLVPTDGSTPTTAPEERPIGRAALQLATRGIDVIFGDTLCAGRMSGFRATMQGWKAAKDIAIGGLHDRFPSQLRAEKYEEILRESRDIPMGNSHAVTLLCRDKLQTQESLQALGIPMPAVQGDPTRFSSDLSLWGHGYLKPRYGALGIGVRRVSPGDPLPTHTTGVVPDRPDPTILQAAVTPPAGWASRTVRVLIQRLSLIHI